MARGERGEVAPVLLEFIEGIKYGFVTMAATRK